MNDQPHSPLLDQPHDVILSSGFLAFSRHLGVLRAIEARGVPVAAVTGTSSGALVGALWAAGHTTQTLEQTIGALAPWQLLRPHPWLWQGVLSMEAFLAFVRPLLPPTFADLPVPLAVGVIDAQKRHLHASKPTCQSKLFGTSFAL